MVAPSSTATAKSCEVPMESRARPCASASSRRAAKWLRLSSATSENGGIVMSPPTRTGTRSRKAPSSAGRAAAVPPPPAPPPPAPPPAPPPPPPPPPLPFPFFWAQRGVRGDGVDELGVRQDLLDLA